jgi:hypothetical protein
MSYSRPFITPTFTAYAGDSALHALSLAVPVIDTFTGETAGVLLRVRLKERKQARTIVNNSGIFCFEDVPAGNYTIVAEPDRVSADWYFLAPLAAQPWPSNFEQPVTIPVAGPGAPVVTVSLTPNPSYPFPPGTTLVRGQVTKGGPNNLMSGAVLSTTYDQTDPADPLQTVAVNVATKSDANGEYVLFFQKLPAAAQPVTVHAVLGAQQMDQAVNIFEGQTVRSSFAFP